MSTVITAMESMVPTENRSRYPIPTQMDAIVGSSVSITAALPARPADQRRGPRGLQGARLLPGTRPGELRRPLSRLLEAVGARAGEKAGP